MQRATDIIKAPSLFKRNISFNCQPANTQIHQSTLDSVYESFIPTYNGRLATLYAAELIMSKYVTKHIFVVDFRFSCWIACISISFIATHVNDWFWSCFHNFRMEEVREVGKEDAIHGSKRRMSAGISSITLLTIV